MNRCYLSLGSNQKAPERQIRNAINAIKKLPGTSIHKVSDLYWTKAWGVQTQQDFCNNVVAINTLLKPDLLLKHCQNIEQKQGRVRKKRWGPRTLDIDIIFYGNRVIKKKQLTVPHPFFLSRDFVVNPLKELISEKKWPVRNS